MIFATNKTVPLTKDIGCSSTFLHSLGITTARTDLDTVLLAIDLALSAEITARTTGDAAVNARVDNHLASTTAHTAANLVSVPSGNLAATTGQGALNELQSDIDKLATSSALTSEITARTTGDTALQNQIDGERTPLRMTISTTTTVAIASARGTRRNAVGAVSDLVVPNGSIVAGFTGATVNFAAGTITYTAGGSESFTRISFSGQAGRFAKYAIVLLPNEKLMVIPGTVFGATAGAATEPAFSGGVPVGFVTVQDNGSGGIGSIALLTEASLAQALAVGADNVGNSGSPLDPNDEETFQYYTRSDFSIENKRFVASTTGSDQILGLKKLVLDQGRQLVTTDLTGPLLYADTSSINQAQSRLVYGDLKSDLVPFVEFSRTGGASWSAGPYQPEAIFDNQAIADSARAIFGVGAGANQEAFAQAIVITHPTKITKVVLHSLYRSSNSPLGSVYVRIVKAAANGAPSTSAADLMASSQSVLVSSLGTATPAAHTMMFSSQPTLIPGTYFILLAGDETYKTSSTSVNNARFQVNAADSTSKYSYLASNNTWTRSETTVLAYDLYGQKIRYAINEGNTVVQDVSFTGIELLDSGAAAAAPTALSSNSVAAIFTPPYRILLTSVEAFIKTASTTGNVRAALYEVASGIPSTLVATSTQEYPVAQMGNGYAYRSFSFSPITVSAGKRYALVVSGIGTNAAIDFAVAPTPDSFNTSAATNAGSGWTASGTGLSYRLATTGADLRMRITSGTNGSELIGFGVNYCHSGPSPFPAEVTIINDLLSVTARATLLENSTESLESDVADVYSRTARLEDKMWGVHHAIVGSSYQESAGTAHYSSIVDAIAAAPHGGKITILPGTYTGALTVNKKIFFEGLGHGTVISGTVTIQAEAAGSMFKFVRFAENVTINAGANNINLTDCWVASGKSVTNNGTNNLILAIGE